MFYACFSQCVATLTDVEKEGKSTVSDPIQLSSIIQYLTCLSTSNTHNRFHQTCVKYSKVISKYKLCTRVSEDKMNNLFKLCPKQHLC